MATKDVDDATGQRTPKKNRKRKDRADSENQDMEPGSSLTHIAKKPSRWTNKERVLIFCSRGITFRPRHLMIDLRTLLPHSKADTKLDHKDQLFIVNEVCEMKNCNKCIFFQMRKKQDLYMWVSQVPDGPSAKFLIQNVHTMDELKMTGNCLKGSRPLLTFDSTFDSSPHYQLLKELFIQVFGTPYYHPKSKPFVDHIFHFSIADSRIWFRNYQIINDGASLTEIGPRFVMNPVKIFEGSFGGPTLYENPKYVSPNVYRSLLRRKRGMKYKNRMESKRAYEEKVRKWDIPEDPYEQLFAKDSD